MEHLPCLVSSTARVTRVTGHARSQGLILVTSNRREFDRVPGLRVEDWTSEAF